MTVFNQSVRRCQRCQWQRQPIFISILITLARFMPLSPSFTFGRFWIRLITNNWNGYNHWWWWCCCRCCGCCWCCACFWLFFLSVEKWREIFKTKHLRNVRDWEGDRKREWMINWWDMANTFMHETRYLHYMLTTNEMWLNLMRNWWKVYTLKWIEREKRRERLCDEDSWLLFTLNTSPLRSASLLAHLVVQLRAPIYCLLVHSRPHCQLII